MLLLITQCSYDIVVMFQDEGRQHWFSWMVLLSLCAMVHSLTNQNLFKVISNPIIVEHKGKHLNIILISVFMQTFGLDLQISLWIFISRSCSLPGADPECILWIQSTYQAKIEEKSIFIYYYYPVRRGQVMVGNYFNVFR